jgi:hypothetical protein
MMGAKMKLTRTKTKRDAGLNRSTSMRRDEEGFALLFAMLALLLLSSIGLAMIYASDTETSIDSNYKDQVRASYAAYSALEEAKDRLRQGCGISSTCNSMPWPSDIPTTSGNSNIIYIINPKPGEHVYPWDPTNPYYDTEICDTNNENFPNNFCASRPTGIGSYTVYCNGASADCPSGSNPYTTTINAPWKRSVPLDYKWIRINLKTERMLPGYPVNASTTTNGIVCWDGHGQLKPGGGYQTDCTPKGGLVIGATGLTGAGWTGAPTVTLGPPDVGGGAQAAYALNTNSVPNTLINVVLDNPGSGYTSTPTVVLSDTTHGGVITAHAVPTGAPISSLALNTGGAGSATSPCFEGTTTMPTPNISGGGGSGASAEATWSGVTCIAKIKVTGSCNGNNYKSANFTGVTLTGGAGAGMKMTLTTDAGGSFTNGTTTVTAGGLGYTSSTGLKVATDSNINGGCENNLSVTMTLGQQLTGLALKSVVGSGGSGFTGTPTTPSVCTSGCPIIGFSAPPNVGAMPTGKFVIGTPVTNAGQIDSLTISAAGSGYTAAPTLTITGGGGTGAAGHVSITNNTLVLVEPSSYTSGSGYTTVPTCTLSGGGLVGNYNCFDGSANGLRLNIAAGASTYYGQVAQVTAYAKTPTLSSRHGAEFTTQMELATSVRLPAKFNIGGAITLAGPSIIYDPPNSDPYIVNGTDGGTCGNGSAKPGIGVIDDPANPQGLVASVIADIPSGRTGNYTGSGAAPDVENAFSALGGSPTPATLDALLSVLRSETQSGNLYTSPGGGTLNTYTALNNLTPSGSPPINFVDGNLDLDGNFTGSGILVVTGALTFHGDYHWNGLVLAIGKGVVDLQGGGNGTINGSLYLANIYGNDGAMLDQLGTTTLHNNGGGGNGVQYNSCYADAYLTQLPKIAADPSTMPGKVLSVRTVTRQN